MLLTLTNTQPPATDLGFLLHKHPDLERYSLGAAHVFGVLALGSEPVDPRL